MKQQNEPRHIDLHLPTGWARCSTDELEHIAAAILMEQQRQDRFHPFSWDAVRLMAVLAINGIEIVSTPDATALGDSVAEYTVRRADEQPWPITTDQLLSLCERLAWIEHPDSGQPITQFPYPTLMYDTARRRWLTADEQAKAEAKTAKAAATVPAGSPAGMLVYHGAPPMMDGYTWTEYRHLQDWMTLYMRLQNAARDASDAQAQFLAVLFQPAVAPASATVPDGSPSGNSTAAPSPSIPQPFSAVLTADPAAPFRSFDPIRWQVILFWWSGLMRQLQQEYPKVFKPQPVGRGKKDRGPWSFYNRVTATIQKYIGLNEQEVNQGTYSVILQHMENMAEEADEMKKLNQKYKGKK